MVRSRALEIARLLWPLRYALAITALVYLPIPTPAQTFSKNGVSASFTAAQAAQGQKAYDSNCAMCHGADLTGQLGPALAGDTFKAKWGVQSASVLYAYIHATMPQSAPGARDQKTYSEIVAYILQTNQIPAKETEFVPVLAESTPMTQTAAGSLPFIQIAGLPSGPTNHDGAYTAEKTHRQATLEKVSSVTDAMLREPPDTDWLNWRRDYGSLGFSPLHQINKRNANDLKVAWSWSMAPSPDEITPLVHDGVIFIKSGNRVQALDGATGDLLWEYVRPLPDEQRNGASEIVKNLAIYQDKIFAPTGDHHMVALDVKSGKVMWDTAVSGDQNFRLDGGPMVANGKVIMGASGCNTRRGGCFIVAFDAQTGAEAWRFNTIARPGQPGGDSWNGAPVEERYGGAVWTSGSYDASANLLYFGIGQTYDTSTLLVPNATKGESSDGLYTDSTVALNPDTGKLVWYYQHFNRDVWDLDWTFEQSLIDLPVEGSTKKLVVTAGKLGIFDALERANGKYVFSTDLGLQNLVTSIDPVTGKKSLNPLLAPEPNKTKLVCPHTGGVRNWPATSYNSATKLLYVAIVEDCQNFTWLPRDAAATAKGGSDLRRVIVPRPDSDGKFGRIEAINLETKKVVWTQRRRAPESSSMLATAGSVLFEGSRDRKFRALDDLTGKILWETRLNAVPSSSPVTYAINGVQYVAVVTGGGGALDATWVPLTPEIENTLGSTTLWIFKLSDKNSAVSK